MVQPAPSAGEFELAIMIWRTEEMHGWDRVPDLNRIASEPMVGFSESKMARSSECTPDYAQKGC